MSSTQDLNAISDDDLLRRLAELLKHSRRVEGDLVAHIGEVDKRRLFAREASSSMFAYATEVLHLSEAEAYLRIAAARASRKYPMLLEMLRDGRIHLSGVGKLAPYLTDANCDAVLARAVQVAVALEIDGDDRLRSPVGEPQTVVVSARRLAERENGRRHACHGAVCGACE